MQQYQQPPPATSFNELRKLGRSNSSLSQNQTFFKNYRTNLSHSRTQSSSVEIENNDNTVLKCLTPDLSSQIKPEEETRNRSMTTAVTQKEKSIQQNNQVEIKYQSQKIGELITSGNVIAAQIKKLQNDSNINDTKESEEEFFRKIDSREMTEKDKNHYKRVVEEYYQTEKSHIEGLNLLKKIYLETIGDNCNKNDVMFVNEVKTQVDVILSIHINFLQMFEESYRNTKKDELPLFGLEFVKNLQFLKMASHYIGNYDNYRDKLTEIISKDSSIEKAINKAKNKYIKENENKNITLQSIQHISFYLITPIQRIPRYELLLRDMLKDCGKDFPDLDQLKKAYIAAKESGKGVNMTRTQIEENEKITTIRSIVKGKSHVEYQPARKFICCGSLYNITDVYDEPSDMRYIFLFNDLIVETKPIKMNGKSVESDDQKKKAFDALNEMKDIDQIKNFEFEILRELSFELGTCKFNPIKDSTKVKHLFSMMVKENKIIRDKAGKFTTIIKYAALDDESKEVWKSIIFDQFQRVDEIIERKKEIQSIKSETIDFELSNQPIQPVKPARSTMTPTQPMKSTRTVMSPTQQTTTSTQQDTSTSQTKIMGQVKPVTTTIPLISKTEKPKQQFQIVYKASKPGTMVTSGNVIQQVLKTTMECEYNKVHPQDEEFFKQINSREMTDENKKHYKMVFHEMIVSETIHVKGLELLKEIYLLPMINTNKPEPMKLGKEISSQIDMLVGAHKKFLKMMEDSEKEATDETLPQLGNNFVSQLQFLKMAGTYISKYPSYLERVTEMMQKDKDVVKAQTKAKQDYMKINPNAKIEMISFYLITPIQRIPRYELLLRDMLKDCGKDFPGLETLKNAYTEAKKSGQGVNQTRMELEESKKISLIEEVVKGFPKNDVSSSRKFICCGPVFLAKNMNDPVSQIVYLFLFTDIIIETKIKKYKGMKIVEQEGVCDKVLFLDLLKINDIEQLTDIELVCESIYHIESDCKIMPQQDSSTVKNVFMMHMYSNGPKKEKVFIKYSCQTLEEKEVWKSIINDQIEHKKVLLEKNKSASEKVTETLEQSLNDSLKTPKNTNTTKPHTEQTIRFVAKPAGTLVQKSGTIHEVKNYLKQNHKCESSIESVFEAIEKRRMTKEHENNYLKIVEDLATTEQQHINDLMIFKEVYLQSILSVTKKDHLTTINDIISQIDSMVIVHQAIYDICSRVITSPNKAPRIGDDILKQFQYVKMEMSFATKLEEYKKTIDEISKETASIKAHNKAKEIYLKRTGEHEVLNISYYLNRPTTHLKKYESVFKSMLKCLSSTYVDVEPLKKVYYEAIDISSKLASMKTSTEEFDKYNIVRNSIKGELSFEDNSIHSFICCGQMYKLTSLSQQLNKGCYTFLFNDRLVEAMPKKYHGKPIKDVNDSINLLRYLNNLNDIEKWEFSIEREYIFDTETTLEYREEKKEDGKKELNKNLIILRVQQIPLMYATANTSEAVVWNSVIFDQIEKLKENILPKLHSPSFESEQPKAKPVRIGLRPPQAFDSQRTPIKKANSPRLQHQDSSNNQNGFNSPKSKIMEKTFGSKSSQSTPTLQDSNN